jgi:hypothetical protein
MTGDSKLFNRDRDGYPLYEGKLIAAFDHEYSSPSYWINEKLARDSERTSYWRTLTRRGGQPKILDLDCYRTVFRNIAASTNERAFLCTVLPPKVACPHTMMVVRRLVPEETTGESRELINSAESLFLACVFSSFICDFLIRMKITTHLDMHFVYSLPVPRLDRRDSNSAEYFWPSVARVLRLICTTAEYASLWAEIFPQIVQSAKEFTLKVGSEEKLALDVLKFGASYKERANDPERAEYFVRIHWLQTVAENEAINEVGLFGNQNTVCQPTAPKWRHTIERLKTRFKAWNS